MELDQEELDQEELDQVELGLVELDQVVLDQVRMATKVFCLVKVAEINLFIIK